MKRTQNETKPEHPETSVFEALNEHYAVRKGACFNVAEALRDVYGGEIAFVTDNGHPLHAFVRLPNGQHCDGAGFASPDEIMEAFEEEAGSCSIRPALESDWSQTQADVVEDMKELIRQNDSRL